jgi:hypothetical protein
LGIQLVPFRRFQLRYPGRSEANFAEHTEVLSAILSGDADKAAALFRRHATVQGDALAEYISIFNSRGGLRAISMSDSVPMQDDAYACRIFDLTNPTHNGVGPAK